MLKQVLHINENKERSSVGTAVSPSLPVDMLDYSYISSGIAESRHNLFRLPCSSYSLGFLFTYQLGDSGNPQWPEQSAWQSILSCSAAQALWNSIWTPCLPAELSSQASQTSVAVCRLEQNNSWWFTCSHSKSSDLPSRTIYQHRQFTNNIPLRKLYFEHRWNTITD